MVTYKNNHIDSFADNSLVHLPFLNCILNPLQEETPYSLLDIHLAFGWYTYYVGWDLLVPYYNLIVKMKILLC